MTDCADETVEEERVTSEVTGEMVPGVTDIVGEVEVTGVPSNVAFIEVGLPASAPVKVAV